MIRSVLIILFIFFYSSNVFACSCTFAWNDSFSRTIKNSEFVALVKIISFDKYLDEDILGHNGKMPYSMTVEIIKKYKGNEQRKKIKILGDNGMLCRPYLSNFKINSYYLVSPNALDNSANTEYDFFSCRTEYLNVDIDSNVALGNYSLIRNQINLDKFENKVKNGDWDILLLSLILSSIILLLLFMRRNIKRKTNRSSD
ncbi:hypothetical protein J8L88_20330 [Aquimarina sp. MMG015]|uniref:hypothetical protein n=2 Tax=Aquimarina TaxID=290174 RepID=UPI0011C34F1B|nr:MULTISPECIES: hypothetical protein [unclassified Aquimarina]MBQ4805220.1 hypothetical protein [Aquimarina sp. MMG015]